MIPSIVIVVLLVIVFYRLARKGKIGNFSGGIGNALFQFHAFVRPTTYNIAEAKKQRKRETKQGDDGPPELPLRAQTGSPEEVLRSGLRALDPVLVPHGFEFIFERAGKGSGGHFASGSYVRGDRSLELHFRETLGLVTYQIGESSLDHESYMRLLGVYGKNSYPDFPADPLESFKSLAQDLLYFCSDFLTGDGAQFHRYAAELKNKPKMFSGLP